jgi:membrane protein DedA with SNARE-associated domain
MFATAVGIVPMVAVYVSIGAAGREAALASAGGYQSETEWIVLGVGLLVTIAAGILIARGAKRELAGLRRERVGSESL